MILSLKDIYLINKVVVYYGKQRHTKINTQWTKNTINCKWCFFKENASKEELIKLLENHIEKINFDKKIEENNKTERTTKPTNSKTQKDIKNEKNNDELKKQVDNDEEILGLAVLEQDTEEKRISLRENTIEEKKVIKEQSEAIEDKEEEFELDGLANAGTILNIIGAALWLPFTIMASLVIIGIPFLIGDIFTITSNLAYRKGKGSRMKAGILGILFGFLIGGILVLVAKDQSVKKDK